MMGREGWGGSIFEAPLPLISGSIGGRYELTPPVVPPEDIFLPEQNALSPYSLVEATAGMAALFLLQRNSLLSIHIRCRTAARRLATAPMARRIPRR
jgi:hypothetical protein